MVVEEPDKRSIPCFSEKITETEATTPLPKCVWGSIACEDVFFFVCIEN
jgi:hypothetical protein